jgi:hypothetical protein
MRNGLGVAALVVGILALLTSWTVVGGIVLGLAAIVLGAVGAAGPSAGRPTTAAPRSPASCSVCSAWSSAWLPSRAGVAYFQSDSGQQLVDCLEQAGNDAAAQEVCQREVFEELGQ